MESIGNELVNKDSSVVLNDIDNVAMFKHDVFTEDALSFVTSDLQLNQPEEESMRRCAARNCHFTSSEARSAAGTKPTVDCRRSVAVSDEGRGSN